MPTPTPLPYSPQVTQGLQILDETVKQGIVGVLLLVAIIGVVLSVAVAIVAWTRRNKKDNSSTINEALLTFARMDEEQLKRSESEKVWQRKMDMRRDIQIKRMNNRQIESITALSDSNNKLADAMAVSNTVLDAINKNNQMQTMNTDAMRSDLNAMRESGSIPLQNAIISINAIKEMVTNISIRQLDDRAFFERTIVFLTGAMDTLTRIEQRHKTGEFPPVQTSED
jgi:hypothetical protein